MLTMFEKHFKVTTKVKTHYDIYCLGWGGSQRVCACVYRWMCLVCVWVCWVCLCG